MPKTIFGLILFVFIFYSANSQTQREIDSMKTLLISVKEPALKLDLYNKLSVAYVDKDVSLSRQYADSLEVLSSSLNNEEMQMRATYNKGGSCKGGR